MNLRRFPRTEALPPVTASLAASGAVNVRAHHNRKEVAVMDAVAVTAQVTNSPQFPQVVKTQRAVLQC